MSDNDTGNPVSTGVDLSSIDIKEKSDKGSKMDIRHPVTDELIYDEKGEKQYVVLAGYYSDTFQKAQRSSTDRRLAKRMKGNRVKITSAEIDRDNIEILSKCVIDWNIVIGGEHVPNDFDHVYGVLSDNRFAWLRDQIDEYISDESNFT